MFSSLKTTFSTDSDNSSSSYTLSRSCDKNLIFFTVLSDSYSSSLQTIPIESIYNLLLFSALTASSMESSYTDILFSSIYYSCVKCEFSIDAIFSILILLGSLRGVQNIG